METILVIKHGALGDFVMTLGCIEGVRKHHPKAKFVLLTSAGMVKIAEQTGWFDEIIIDNRTRSVKDWYRICKTVLADRYFDYIYDFQSNRRTLKKYYPLARFITKNPMNWGFWRDGFEFHKTPAKHRFTFCKPVIETIHVPGLQNDLSFCHGPQQYFYLLPEKYALLIPGCSAKNSGKRWPASSYRAITEWLGKKNIKSVIMGTSAEEAEITAICKDNPNAINFMNKTTLLDIPDLARGSVIVIGNDTGPTHMARLTGKEIIILNREQNARGEFKTKNATCLVAPQVSDITSNQVIDVLKQKLKG